MGPSGGGRTSTGSWSIGRGNGSSTIPLASSIARPFLDLLAHGRQGQKAVQGARHPPPRPGQRRWRRPAPPLQVCTGFGAAFAASKPTERSATPAAADAGGGQPAAGRGERGCPETSGSLGRAGERTAHGAPRRPRSPRRTGWSVLHTMAAYYPTTPSAAENSGMRDFIGLFARFYPCGHCAEHMTAHIAEHPPQTHSARRPSLRLPTPLCNP